MKQVASENETIEVNDLIAFISDDKNAEVKYEKKKATKQPANNKSPEAAVKKASKNTHSGEVVDHNFDSVKSSPLVRKLAIEHNIDLKRVRGTGLNHRITKKDVLNYLEYGSDEVIVEKIISAPKGSEAVRTPTVTKDGKEFLEGVEVTREAMNRIRQLTADHMLDSVRIAPHVTTTSSLHG